MLAVHYNDWWCVAALMLIDLTIKTIKESSSFYLRDFFHTSFLIYNQGDQSWLDSSEIIDTNSCKVDLLSYYDKMLWSIRVLTAIWIKHYKSSFVKQIACFDSFLLPSLKWFNYNDHLNVEVYSGLWFLGIHFKQKWLQYNNNN